MKHLIVMALGLSFATVTSANDVIVEYLKSEKTRLELRIQNVKEEGQVFGVHVPGVKEERETFWNFKTNIRQQITDDVSLHYNMIIAAAIKISHMTGEESNSQNLNLTCNPSSDKELTSEVKLFCEETAAALEKISNRITINKALLKTYDSSPKLAQTQIYFLDRIKSMESNLDRVNRQLTQYAPASSSSDKEMSSYFDPEVQVARILDRRNKQPSDDEINYENR